MDWLLVSVSLGLAAWAFYKWATANNDYFAVRNVPFIKPTFFLGTTGPFLLKKYRSNEFADILYKTFPSEK